MRLAIRWRTLSFGIASCWLTACGDVAPLAVADGTGPQPSLPAPQTSLIPVINVAPAIGWPHGVKPFAAKGTQVRAYANSLEHPRWLYLLPNGDVLVSESAAPARDNESPSLRAWIAGYFMRRAGADKPSANRITLLRDTDGDGRANLYSVLLDNLNSPFGIALVGNHLYVANTDAVLRFPYATGDMYIDAPGEKLVDLPAGSINSHWTRNLLASADGSKLYVTIGSNSNVGEHGMQIEENRAAIWEVDISRASYRVFASGLRNPNGMAWETVTGTLWTVVNERDELGNDLVPDYLTSVRDGGFYGWPYSYFGQHVDARVSPQQPDLVARAIAPDYALGPHTASLGLASSVGTSLPSPFTNGMFVGQHGSWNRKPHSGYKVIHVPFEKGKPVGPPVDVLTGFLSAAGEAYGRPVGVALDRHGALLVADDVGNMIWHVTHDGIVAPPQRSDLDEWRSHPPTELARRHSD